MSAMGILSNSLLNYFTQPTQPAQHKGQQLQQDFQKLGSDLSSGNLSGAQSDFAAIQQLMPGMASAAQSQSNIATAFNKLSSDLKSGNVTAAQQDYATLQQDMQNFHGHHHHQHTGGVNASSTVSEIFSQLGQALQSGNLTAAQQAYTTLQQDFAQYAAGGGSSAASQAVTSALSVMA